MKSKVFIKLLISYVVILVIPITLLSSFIYVRFVNTLKEEVINSTTGMLSQVRDVMDGHIKNLNNISAQINVNNHISPLIYDGDIDASDLFPDVQEAIEELKNYRVTNSIISNVMLYFRSSGDIITDTSKYDSFSYFSRYFVWPEMSAEEVNKKLTDIKAPVISESQPIYIDFNLNNTITYMRPMPINLSFPTSTLLITLDNAVIDKMVEKVLGSYSGTFYMIDNNNNIIKTSSLGMAPIEPEKAHNIIKTINSKNISEYNYKDNNLIITFSKSNITGWQYAAIIDSKPILMKIEYVKSTALKVIFTCLLVGLLLAYLFSKKNYGKIKKITDFIAGHSHESMSRYKNEWDFIDGAIGNYIRENNELQRRLDDQMPVMKNNFFTRLIKGRFNSINQISSIMTFLNINIGNGPYAIILLNLNFEINSNPELTQGVLRVTISNASEKFCEDIGTGYAIELDLDRIAILVSMEKLHTEKFDIRLKDIGENIRAFVQDNFAMTVTIGISSECSELIYINRAYEEALTTLDYKMIKGKDAVICFSEINNRIHNGSYYSFNQEKQIISYLKIGEFDAIKEILDGVVDSIKREPISLEMVKCIYFEIVNTAIKALHELGLGFGQIKNYLPSLVNTRSIDEVCHEVCKFYDEVCQQVNSSKYSKSVELVDNIMNYLNTNYADKMISVDLISDVFSVSPSYLSHIFKERSGQNFIDFLHSLRLNRAMTLLTETENNITDIALSVGYNSSHNFIRVFKRYEGITPTEYRLAEKSRKHLIS